MSDDDAEMENISEDGGESVDDNYGVNVSGKAAPANGDELVVTDDDSEEDHQQGGGNGYNPDSIHAYNPWDNDGNEASTHYDFGNANFGADADSDADDDDDDGAEDDFDIEEEEDEDAALEAELQAVMEEMQTYDQWKELDTRTKLFSIVEPGITAECDIPPARLKVTTVYAVLYFLAVLLQVGTLVLLTFEQAIASADYSNTFRWILLITCCFFAFDLLFRSLTCTRMAKVPMIFLDVLTLGSAVVIFLDLQAYVGLQAYVEYAQFIVPLRASRMFLITRLFLHTDTFRDINMAFITIANSAKSLSIFICLLVVGLFVFSTAVYLLERGEFDPVQQAWYRPCIDLGPCETQRSPFQSIPDALWLIINTMTTVGLGDVYPATTPGRVVTGMAMIAGVFVIAFPTMVLVGNLTLVRKNYFREEEKERLMMEDAELYFLEQKRAAKEQKEKEGGAGAGDLGFGSFEISVNPGNKGRGEFDADSDSDSDGGSGSGPGGSTRGSMRSLTAARGGAGMQSLHSMSQVGSSSAVIALANKNPNVKSRSYFAYMGDPSREIRMTKNPQVFHYQPLLQVLCLEDGKPRLSCIHQVSETIATCQLTLVLDDITAQRAAEKAIRGGDSYGDTPIFCRATPLYGIEVNLTTRISGVRLNRRSDVGIVHDLCVPLTLTVSYDGEDELQDRMDSVRDDLQNAQLTIQVSTQPMSSGLWMETCFLTSDMLAPTPFVVDLKAIAQHLSTDFLSTNQAERLANPEYHISKYKDYAFCTYDQLTMMMKPVLTLFIGEGEIIRNATQVLEGLVRVIILHCRQWRLADLPPTVHPAVFGVTNLKPHERLYEIDVDFFRTADWPLGSVRVEKATRCKAVHVSSIIGTAKGFTQPELFNADAFTNPFRPNISLETTMARDHAFDEVREAQEEQSRQLAEQAKKAQELLDRRERKRKNASDPDFDGVAMSPGQTEEQVVYEESDDGSDMGNGYRQDSESDRGSVDDEGLTAEERNQVQQALLFGIKSAM